MPCHRRAVVVTAAALLAGCASNPVPRGYLPTAQQAQREARGGWIVIRAGGGATLSGELLAVGPEVISVLTPEGTVERPRASLSAATLYCYVGASNAIAVGSALGGLSTLSHGGFLIFTLPMWAIAGPLAASADRRSTALGGGAVDLDALRAYARFPQGPPDGVDLRALKFELPVRAVDEDRHRR